MIWGDVLENNKTVLITGGTSGIGLATAKLLISQQYRVIIIGSTQSKIDSVKGDIQSEYPHAEVAYFFADLSVQKSIYQLAEQIGQYLNIYCGGKLDVLINNAGGVRDHYTETPDGIEYQFALNHLSGFLFSHTLLPYLHNGIILFTGSYSHQKAKIHWHNIFLKNRYFIFTAYRQSKLCNVMTAKYFNQILSPMNIRSYVVDPGLVKTDIASKHTSWLVRWVWSKRSIKGVSPDIPAKTYLYLIENRPLEGLYFIGEKAVSYNKTVDNPFLTKRLFELSEKLCNIDFLISLPTSHL